MRIQHSYLLPLLLLLGACSKDNNSATSANSTAASPAASTTASPSMAPLPAAVAAVPLSFPTYGFQIDSFDAPTNGAIQAMAMYLPLPPAPVTKPGEAPPPRMSSFVNVQVQPYPDTMAKYMAASKDQFKQINFTVIKESNPNPNEWIIEYQGLVQATALRWYAHAILVNNKIIVATGTSLDSQWSDCADKIRACVDSLALTTASGAGLTMPNYGFRINPLEATLDSNPVVVQPLIMAIPGDSNGSPTVNIQIQPPPKNVTSMADYMKQSKEDMAKSVDNVFGIKGEQNPSANEWVLEYMGIVNNQAMHFIAHAIWANNRVYLATGSAPDSEWSDFGDRLKACVSTFKVTSTTPFPAIAWPVEATPPADASGNMTLTNGNTTAPAPAAGTTP
jgi:hypothetical protein